MLLRVSTKYGLGHGTIVSWIWQGLDPLKITAKALKVVSSNWTFEFRKSEMIIDDAIFVSKFQQK